MLYSNIQYISPLLGAIRIANLDCIHYEARITPNIDQMWIQKQQP